MEDTSRYHPDISFAGEAYDSLYNILSGFRGYGVTLALEDGSEVEAVFIEGTYSEENDRAEVRFYRAKDEQDFPVVEAIQPEDIEQAFAKRIYIH